MFERYTERARRVIFFARYEASQLGSSSIETEHLLLGLIREGKGLTSRIFAKSHVSMETIRKEIEGRAIDRDRTSTSADIPLSVESKRVLGYAAEEAERMLHDYIGTEHLLLGLMREEKSVAASILADKGMRLTAVREDAVRLLNERATVGVIGQLQRQLVGEFAQEITNEQIKTGRIRDQLRVQIAEALLFEPGEATIKPGGLEVVRRVTSELKKAEGYRIEVRGHTDYFPITGTQAQRFPTNWDLSAARAIEVALCLQHEIRLDPRLVGATACVSYRFRAPSASDEGQRRNPQIEILLAPALAPEEPDPH